MIPSFFTLTLYIFSHLSRKKKTISHKTSENTGSSATKFTELPVFSCLLEKLRLSCK